MEKFTLVSISYSSKRGRLLVLSDESFYSKEQIKLINEGYDAYKKSTEQLTLDLEKAVGLVAERKIKKKFEEDMSNIVDKELNLSYRQCFLLWHTSDFVIPFIEKNEFLK